MQKTRSRKNEVKTFILYCIYLEKDYLELAQKHFGISRQSIYRHINELVNNGLIIDYKVESKNRGHKYALTTTELGEKTLPLADFSGEDEIFKKEILPLVKNVIKNENVNKIIEYGCTEMINNAIDHSGSKMIHIKVEHSLISIIITITDLGIGIFNKIMKDFSLDDPRQAMLELSKGKLTSDPSRHTGEGIFFTSRMFDKFTIFSGLHSFIRTIESEQWLFENDENLTGTSVHMEIEKNSSRTTKEIFEEFASEDDDFSFSKTHIPIMLSNYEGGSLVSRSQAKRILSRCEKFKEIILDFKGINEIGPAFTDEIFRVFSLAHPEVKVYAIRASKQVKGMIERAEKEKRSGKIPKRK